MVKFSVYVVWLFVLNLNNIQILKIHKSVKKISIQGKLNLRYLF